MRRITLAALAAGTLMSDMGWAVAQTAEAALIQMAQATPLRCGASTQQALDQINHGVALTDGATTAREEGRLQDAVTLAGEALRQFPLPRCSEPYALALYEQGLAYHDIPMMGEQAAEVLLNAIDQIELARRAGVQMPNADLLITNALNVLGGLATRDGNAVLASGRYDAMANYILTEGQRAMITANHAAALFVTYFRAMGPVNPPAEAVAGIERAFCLYQLAVIGYNANRGALELVSGLIFDEAMANFQDNIATIRRLLGADPPCPA